MLSRFVSNVVVLVSSAFLVVARVAFGFEPLRWIGFGTGALVVLTVAAGFLVRGRGFAQRVLDLIVVTAGGWALVSSLTFGPGTVRWLTLLEGGGLAGLALLGLVMHEIRMERATRAALAGARGDQHLSAVRSHEDGSAAAISVARWPS